MLEHLYITLFNQTNLLIAITIKYKFVIFVYIKVVKNCTIIHLMIKTTQL